jgi:hypothetical protein
LKHFKQLGVALCVAALSAPGAVLAHGPSDDHGQAGKPHGHNQASKRCKHQPKVGFALGGTLDPTSTAGAIVVDVTHSNKHSRPFVDATTKKYSVPADASVKFVGANPFTTPGADLGKYKVQVIGRVIKHKKGCTDDNSPAPTIRKVVITAPDASGEQEQEQENEQPQS